MGARGQSGEERTNGSESVHGRSLDRILKAWSARPFFTDAMRSVELCIATAGIENYVGILRPTAIHASMSAVGNVLDDVEHYKNLVPGVVEVRVASGSKTEDRFVTIWEQRVPIPIMPNVV